MAYLRRRRTKELRDQFDARGEPSREGWHRALRKSPRQVVPIVKLGEIDDIQQARRVEKQLENNATGKKAGK